MLNQIEQASKQQSKMSNSKTSSGSAENFDHTCVKISNLRKFNGVQRHIDTILDQIVPRLGPIAYSVIFKRGTIQDRELTTGFIQLEDTENHRLLQQILNGYNFHPDESAGKYQFSKHTLETEVKGDFNFQFIDDDYTPRPINCDECSNFHLYMNRIIANMESNTPQTARIHTPIPTTINTFYPAKRILSMDDLTLTKRLKQEIKSPNKYTPPTTQTAQEQTSDNEDTDVQLIGIQIQANNQHISLASITAPPRTTTTTTTIQGVTCSIVIRADETSFKPMISDAKRFKGICTHKYCDSCFQQLTCISLTNEFEWDGFPMINKRYRLKNDPNTIFSCSYCQMNL